MGSKSRDFWLSRLLALPTHANLQLSESDDMDGQNSITESSHPALIDTRQLAARLGLSFHTVRGLRSRNPSALPPAIKIGGNVRWRPGV